jgi:hypothetical protein
MLKIFISRFIDHTNIICNNNKSTFVHPVDVFFILMCIALKTSSKTLSNHRIKCTTCPSLTMIWIDSPPSSLDSSFVFEWLVIVVAST